MRVRLEAAMLLERTGEERIGSERKGKERKGKESGAENM
jgi:hypothetical protein